MTINGVKEIAEMFSIEAAEYRGSHTITKHIEVSDKDMMKRCAKEGKELVTSFAGNRKEVEELISDTLLDEEYQTPECIKEWLDDNSDGGLFYAVKDYPNPVGKGFFRKTWHNWEDGPVKCSSVVVVLKKIERKMDTSFRVVTAYPSVTEEDIKRYKESHTR